MPSSTAMEQQLELLREMIWQTDPYYYDYFSLQHDSLQLFFCYRWHLLWFKREFAYESVFVVWDTILSASKPNRYILCIALAMLFDVKSELMQKCRRFDEILFFLNGRSGKWDVQAILKSASQFELYFEQRWARSQQV